MKQLLAGVLILSSFETLGMAAEKYDTKAFRTVTKLCTPCHGTPFYMAKQLDEDDWDFFFNTKGKLEKVHKGKAKGVSAVKNPLFGHNKKRILKFFIKNAMYSGAVHGCDANFCGTHH